MIYRYSRFAKAGAHFCSRPRAFSLAAAENVVWLVTGLLFGYSASWQLVIFTVPMVFLTQNAQNRGTQAIQVKLDELIRATQGAHNALLDLEERREDNLDACKARYQALTA